MNIDKIASQLKLESLYFSECSISRTGTIEEEKLDKHLNKSINTLSNGKTVVELTFNITKPNNDLLVKVVANGVFSIDNPESDFSQDILKNNTVAIMFPFIRSQVSLLTTQPGMTPVIIPPINTAMFN